MDRWPVRIQLNDDQIEKCHKIVDQLVNLYMQTDPSHRLETEVDKYEKALQALNAIWMPEAFCR